MDFLTAKLNARKRDNLYRQVMPISSAQGTTITRSGHQLLNFSSNDYLGLANHPQVVDACNNAASSYGVGSGSSHLICGHHQAHHALEKQLASWLGRERALLFSTGYMANLGVLTSLATRSDFLFQDKLNHASLLAAASLCGAKMLRYAHNDLNSLEKFLVKHSSSPGNKFIITEGIFSMDGDRADIESLVKLSKAYNAYLIFDEAHSLGVCGNSGIGLGAQFTQQEVPVIIGTLGKAFGTFGAFVAGSEELIENIIQFASSYIYTTALPPAIAAATSKSLQLLASANSARDHLNKLIAYFCQSAHKFGIPLLSSISPIQPVIIGDANKALKISKALLKQGILVSAIRPPTVPVGSARLRITLTASHTQEDIDKLIAALVTVYKAV